MSLWWYAAVYVVGLPLVGFATFFLAYLFASGWTAGQLNTLDRHIRGYKKETPSEGDQ